MTGGCKSVRGLSCLASNDSAMQTDYISHCVNNSYTIAPQQRILNCHKSWRTYGKVIYTVLFKDRVVDVAGALIKRKTIEMNFDGDILQESIAILRKYARVLHDDLDKRFVNTGLVDDGIKAFSLEYDHTRDAEPTDSLERLAKHFDVDFREFHRSWEFLQHEKETFVKDALHGCVISGASRAGLRPTVVWPKILCNLDCNPESLSKAEIAKNALEEFLLIEPTNASVERDANVVRLIREATGNAAEPDLLDSRVRMKIEGPEINKVIYSPNGKLDWHPLLREAAKDFLVDARVMTGTTAGLQRGSYTQDHKANIAAGRKRRRVGIAEDLATDVRLGNEAPDWDEEPDPSEDPGQAQVLCDIDAMLEVDFDAVPFLSTEPPVRGDLHGKGRGRGGGGRGRGGVPLGPAAAEEDQIEKLAADALAEEEGP